MASTHIIYVLVAFAIVRVLCEESQECSEVVSERLWEEFCSCSMGFHSPYDICPCYQNWGKDLIEEAHCDSGSDIWDTFQMACVGFPCEKDLCTDPVNYGSEFSESSACIICFHLGYIFLSVAGMIFLNAS